MSTQRSAPPDSCPCCPYFNEFHGACRHPAHQAVLQALADGQGDCPLYEGIRADAMRELADELN